MSATHQRKSEPEHILLWPESYIGPVNKGIGVKELWIYDDGMMIKRSVCYSPGLMKVIDELLINIVDKNRIDPSMDVVKVEIDVEKGEIIVYNNGKGIPIRTYMSEEVYLPQVVFGELHTSGNYNSEDKTLGRKGYGAKLANIFSSMFKIETADGVQTYSQVFEGNMMRTLPYQISTLPATMMDQNWTKITFKPDFKVFGMEGLKDEDVVFLMRKRVVETAACLGKEVKVELNGEGVSIQSFEDYVDLYLSGSKMTDPLPRVMAEKDDTIWEVCVSRSDGKFQQVSLVNSVSTINGGTHVDYITKQVTEYMVKVMKTKSAFADVTTEEVKNSFWVFVNARIDDPTFDSQTKERLTMDQSSFESQGKLSEDFLIKVENLLSTAETRKVFVEKLEDANKAGGELSQRCVLILTEGDSAKSLAMSGISLLNRDYYGVFPLRGKLINVKKASPTEIADSRVVKNIMDILGLKQDTEPDKIEKSLRYGQIMIMTDQDYDGYHIKGLIINFIHTFWPTLLQRKRSFITVLETPYVKASHKTDGSKLCYYSYTEYEKWKNEKKPDLNEWTIKIYKGLGTSTPEEGKEYFSISNIEKHKKNFIWDKYSEAALETAFGKSEAKRRDWIKKYVAGTSLDPEKQQITYSDFINKEFILYSIANIKRSIPSMVDGFKPSQRKVFYSALKRNLIEEVKVSQFAASVAENTSYHHAEQSLVDTIIAMAQDFVGKNNINLLQPNGQFGTRNLGGKDAAFARYIFTKLSPVTRFLFPKDDDKFLSYQNEDGQSIEPHEYFPIIPTVLVNGAKGIGSGWSTSVPKYKPKDIVANVRRLLDGKSMVPMDPWYRGFKGKIEKKVPTKGPAYYTTTGVCEKVNENTLRITELPIGKWTQDYKRILRSMKTEECNPFIEDIKDKSDNVSVNLEIQMTKENMKAAQTKGFEIQFELSEKIETNMYLYDEENNLRRFENPEEILKSFYTVRLKRYEIRKKKIEDNLQAELMKLEFKRAFVLGVIRGDIEVYNRTKSDIITQLRAKIPMFEMAWPGHAIAATEDQLDFLFELPISMWILGAVNELGEEIDECNKELTGRRALEAVDLWRKELTAFEEELNKLDIQMALPPETREEANMGETYLVSSSPRNVRGRRK